MLTKDKMLLFVIFLFGMTALFSVAEFASAHSGQSKKNGCHYSKKEKGMHCHHPDLYNRVEALEKKQKQKKKDASPCVNLIGRFLNESWHTKKIHIAQRAIANKCWK